MAQGINQFVKFVRNHLKQYGGKLIIGRGKQVNCNGIMCPGFFDDREILIKMAGNGEGFLSTLVHEYCHFLQYINDIQYNNSNYDMKKMYNFFISYNPTINIDN